MNPQQEGGQGDIPSKDTAAAAYIGEWISSAKALETRIDDLILERIIESGRMERQKLRPLELKTKMDKVELTSNRSEP